MSQISLKRCGKCHQPAQGLPFSLDNLHESRYAHHDRLQEQLLGAKKLPASKEVRNLGSALLLKEVRNLGSALLLKEVRNLGSALLLISHLTTHF